MKKRTNDTIGAGQILNTLRAGPFREPAHAWLYEVRNGTGYNRSERYADALVVSLWPSRGIWFAGIEVKSHRSDWLRELDDPQKAAAIQRWCHYWWVAAPPGVVEVAEVPERWGYYEVDERKAKCVKDAPRLEPESLDAGFVASCLRNAAQQHMFARNVGRDEGVKSTEERLGAAAYGEITDELKSMRAEWQRATYERDRVKTELSNLRENVLRFERAAGIPEGEIDRDGRWSGLGGPGRAYRAAQLLYEIGIENLAMKFSAVAEALRELPDTDKQETAEVQRGEGA